MSSTQIFFLVNLWQEHFFFNVFRPIYAFDNLSTWKFYFFCSIVQVFFLQDEEPLI